jgi:hypothetical protein
LLYLLFGCYGDEDCVEVLCPKGQWHDQCCGKSKPYVCERMVYSDTCWKKQDDKSYWISTEKKNNKYAEADCISKGAKLFEPKNAKQNDFVADRVEKKGLSGFMIGVQCPCHFPSDHEHQS